MTAKALLQKIKTEFPEIKWKQHKFITHGWDHFVIVLDDEIIFRAPKEKPEDLKSELYYETKLLNYLSKKMKIGIPEYKYLSKDNTLAGYKLLKGKEMSTSQFKKLSAKEKVSFTKQLADFLTTLHKTPKSVTKKYDVRIEDPKKLYGWMVQDNKKHISPRLNQKETKIINEYMVELKSAIEQDYPDVLRHGDLTSSHLLWDKKKNQLNIIDFSDRSFGDPANDFYGLWEYGSKFIDKVYSLYKGKKDDQFLYRSQLYYKRVALLVMKAGCTGNSCTFKEGHDMFLKRFKI